MLVETALDDLEELPKLFGRRILAPGQEYFGVKFIVVDSIQGRGVSATATKKYRSLYEFTELSKAHGVVTVLVGHVTKGGQIAGPKDLEHNVDCVMYMRRAFRLRPFFVPKNRFGPAVINPIVLYMDGKGRLEESPHKTGQSTTAHGYGGVGDELAEAQSVVSLPTYGSRPILNAPFLPSRRIKQLITILSQLKDIDISDLSYEINCYLPARQQYRGELDLPIAIALLASYLQRELPSEVLFVGELDLQAKIRKPEDRYLGALADVVTSGAWGNIRKVILSPSGRDYLISMGMLAEGGRRVVDVVDLVPCASLSEVLQTLWPDLEGAY